MKKNYIKPSMEAVECEDLCKDGMNSASWGTGVNKAAPDQKDVDPDKPTVDGEEETPTTWDW